MIRVLLSQQTVQRAKSRRDYPANDLIALTLIHCGRASEHLSRAAIRKAQARLADSTDQLICRRVSIRFLFFKLLFLAPHFPISITRRNPQRLI
jgi:hypothetical protein